MPALAAILNPDAPQDNGVNLYYNTGTAQIALALKSAGGGEDPDTEYWASGAGDFSGHIINPSTVAGGTFRNVNLVVGVTIPYVESGETPTVNQISIVSPIYKKLYSTSLANRNVALSSAGRAAWVYFLDGPDKDHVSLKEYNLVNGNVSTVVKNDDVTLNSSLAAWYEPESKSRRVIYQEKNEGELKEYNVVTRQDHRIDGTDANSLTPIGVSYVDGKVYLYYSDANFHIKRIIKDGTTWGDPHTVEGSPLIGESQLTVVAANGYNHIFYLAQGDTVEDGFTHIRDEIKK